MFFTDLLISMICLLILVVCVLVGVAFLTLLEQKVLGYIQIRKGSNKVGFKGIPQPFSDAIKLFSKEKTFPLLSNYIMYYYSPVMSLFLSLLMWVTRFLYKMIEIWWLLMPYLLGLFMFNLSMLFFLCVTSMGVYTLMIAGWSSN